MHDEQHSGLLNTAITNKEAGHTDAIIRENRCISLGALDEELFVHTKSAHTIAIALLKYHKLCPWVPSMLADVHRIICM